MTCNMMQKSYGSTFKVSFLSVLKLSSCVYQQSWKIFLMIIFCISCSKKNVC